MLSKAAELSDYHQSVCCRSHSLIQQQSLQALIINLGAEVTTALANLGAPEHTLELLHVLAKHSEHGRRTSNEIAEPLSRVSGRSAVLQVFRAAPLRVELLSL